MIKHIATVSLLAATLALAACTSTTDAAEETAGTESSEIQKGVASPGKTCCAICNDVVKFPVGVTIATYEQFQTPKVKATGFTCKNVGEWYCNAAGGGGLYDASWVKTCGQGPAK